MEVITLHGTSELWTFIVEGCPSIRGQNTRTSSMYLFFDRTHWAGV